MSIPISLVVCTHNRVEKLKRFVQGLASVRTAHKWELVIIDNRSDDGTNAFLTSLPRQLGQAEVITAFEPKRGLAAARNRGVSLARGNIIAFSDDDCYLSENYIDAMISAFENLEIGFVAGRILLHDQSDIKLTIQESNDYTVLQPRTFIAAGIVQGANMAFRSTTLDRIGGFDEKLGAGTSFPCEDIDAAAAALWAGIVGAYDPRPLVFHHHGRQTKSEARRIWKTYDKGRGAYFAKYILRADSRAEYVKNWMRAIKRRAITGTPAGRLWSLRQSYREFCGGLHYVATRLSNNKTLHK